MDSYLRWMNGKDMIEKEIEEIESRNAIKKDWA